QPVRPGRVLVAVDRPGSPLQAAVRPQPAGTRNLAADPAGVQDQGGERSQCQGSPDPGPLPGVPLATDPLYRPAVRDILLNGARQLVPGDDLTQSERPGKSHLEKVSFGQKLLDIHQLTHKLPLLVGAGSDIRE